MQTIIQTKAFQEAYNCLNEKQKQAVDAIEGPVMVIAGPGTGKTQILSARIGKILLETDTQPQNILCLTYTDAGSIAMRKRLFSLIGAEAYKVHIYTYHAFCNDIIQQNLHLFEKSQLNLVSDLEQITILKKLIDSFPQGHPLKRYRSDAYHEMNNLKQLFSAMKREAWTPQFINKKIDEYIASLPERDEYKAKKATKDFKKNDIRTDKIEEEKERMEKLRTAANEFNTYQKLMHEANLYDYDDMINWVIEAFENNESLLRRYQEQFLYILVDEYQDTSGIQNKLIELLINYWDKPNVFVVGDDDQSIFRFQGANVENMLNFYKRYENDLFKVVLTNNYRSSQAILDVAQTIIQDNKERLIYELKGLIKNLEASKVRASHLPILREYETQHQEMIGVVHDIEQLILQQKVLPKEIAVIYKENNYGNELMRYCKLKQIPYYSKRQLNVLQTTLIQQLVSILQFLCSEHEAPYSGDALLFEILHFKCFQIPPIHISKLTAEASRTKVNNRNSFLREWLYVQAQQPQASLFQPAIHPNLKKAIQVLEELIGCVPNVTLQSLIELIIQKTGLLHFIMESADKVNLLQILSAFFDFVKEETHRHPFTNLQMLVQQINLMKEQELSIPLFQTYGSENGVHLLTAHGAKGLEFEYVFLVGCNAHLWEKKRKGNNGFSFPDNIYISTNHTNDSALEELRRLFYVAITRAKLQLYLSYFNLKNDGKEAEPSMFFAKIQEAHALPVQKVFLDVEQLTQFRLLEFSEVQPQLKQQVEEDFVSRILEKFELNVTALNHFLHCPLEFYFNSIIRIPAAKNEGMAFGSAIHKALELLFRQMKAEGDVFPSKEQLFQYFQQQMQLNREQFTNEQFARRREQGLEVLSGYYDTYMISCNKIVALERNIFCVMNGIPLRGKIDKIEFDGNNVNIVDYKTGNYEWAKDKLEPPNEKNPLGGDYWRQAVFYKILIDNMANTQWNVGSVEFDFVEPDKSKKYYKKKFYLTPEDVATVKQQIETAWEIIQQHDFYTGCGKETCHWCQFVKTNEMDIALNELTSIEQETAGIDLKNPLGNL